ncbi:STAS domain-containing protein [Saccharothrix sp. AJ9571]|nr:STAS domain-containing protein [Saccharothrix sp. AJ9571]
MHEYICFPTLLPHRTGKPGKAARTVVVRGEIDTVTAPVLADKVADELTGNSRIVLVDLAGVTFFGISGLIVLLDLSERALAANRVLALSGCSPAVLRVLEVTNTLGMFVLDDATRTRAT